MSRRVHRIVFDCERMKYPNTGIYHYCLNLGKALPGFLEDGHESVTYYTPSNALGMFGGQADYLLQHSLHKFHMPKLRDMEIWHGTFQGSNYLPMRNKNIRVVLTIHDLNFLYDDSKNESKKEIYLRRHQALTDRADVIVCISESAKKDVMAYLDTKDKPVEVIYNGTNILQTPSLTQTTYKPSKPFLFSIGCVHRKKNIHSMLPLLEHDDIELVISGRIDDKGYYKDIMMEAEKLQVLDKVRVTGQISEQEKSWYYKNCNAFVFPSKAEGFGLPVVEAMSVGKPVFLSSNAALSEIGGDAAFYFTDFNPEHVRERFRSGMKKYSSTNMKEVIRQRGQSFSWQKAAEAYVGIYRSLY